MATTEERLDAAIDKYEKTYGRLHAVLDHFIGDRPDCPIEAVCGRREDVEEVESVCRCPDDCDRDARDCWHKLADKASDGWRA